jgi:hypothetical protein
MLIFRIKRVAIGEIVNETPDLSESRSNNADVSESALDADAAELATRTEVARQDHPAEAPPLWEPPVLPAWQRDCRRNGGAIASLFLVALLAWITASQTFIVLNDNKLVHPSSLSWPLYVCIAGILAGCYVFAAADHKHLPIYGRQFEAPDHSMKYSLWFQGVEIEWINYEDEPDTQYASLGIMVSNGGHGSPIVVEVERLDIEMNGVKPATVPNFIPLRLLPNQSKRFMSNRLDNIPHGNTAGIIDYSLSYGPVNGFPVYRRTHKVRFQMRKPITPNLIRSEGGPGLTWIELEPEVDIDIYPPPPAKMGKSVRRTMRSSSEAMGEPKVPLIWFPTPSEDIAGKFQHMFPGSFLDN